MAFGSWLDFKFVVLYCLVATLLVRNSGFALLGVDIGHLGLRSSFSLAFLDSESLLDFRVANGHFISVSLLLSLKIWVWGFISIGHCSPAISSMGPRAIGFGSLFRSGLWVADGHLGSVHLGLGYTGFSETILWGPWPPVSCSVWGLALSVSVPSLWVTQDVSLGLRLGRSVSSLVLSASVLHSFVGLTSDTFALFGF